jgi:hypothetical protein
LAACQSAGAQPLASPLSSPYLIDRKTNPF